MITLKKNNITMEVCTDVQASVFERNGYVRVEKHKVEPVPEAGAETVEETPKPQRRRRRKPVENTGQATEPVIETGTE